MGKTSGSSSAKSASSALIRRVLCFLLKAPPNMEGTRTDEIVLRAALRNRVSGDLVINFDELARRCGLGAASARAPWPTIRRKLKDRKDKDECVLAPRECKQLATVYQCSRVEDLKFDFAGVAGDLELDGPAPADDAYREIQKRLTTTNDVFDGSITQIAE